MITVAHFSISKNKSLKILVPHYPKKTNYFYRSSKRIHKFDEGKIIYKDQSQCIILEFDALHVIITGFYNRLKNVLANFNQLPSSVEIGKFEFFYNEITFNETRYGYPEIENIFPQFWLFSYQEIQTWIYNVGNDIYIEISTSYQWLYDEPPERIDIIKEYQEFMKNHKPIAVFSITKEQAQEWFDKCEKLVKDLDICC